MQIVVVENFNDISPENFCFNSKVSTEIKLFMGLLQVL